jgi:hypothetical protein
MGDTATDIEDISRERRAHGDFHQAAVGDLSVTANTLVPLLSRRPIFANHAPPLSIITGTLAHVFDVVDHRRLPHNLWSQKWRTSLRHATLAQMDCRAPSPHRNERACAQTDLDAKSKPLPRISLPSKPYRGTASSPLPRR